MKRYEVVGNETTTLCRVLGEYFTLGAAKKEADRLAKMVPHDPKLRKFWSFDVDDGKGTILYRVSSERARFMFENERENARP